MKKTKIIAAYLPQFHETEENDLFWGKGFTDWNGVKSAKPQYDGHKQPNEPLNDNYYDLSDWKNIKWQAEIAKKYCVDGFNIYHYWFKDGKKMLYKPAELLLEHKEIDIEYFFSWDNCSWVRSWSSIAGNDWSPLSDKKIIGGKECLLELDYGDKKDWEEHFNYLLQFFKDERYIKIDGKPVFAFMTSNDKGRLIEMGEYWKELALKNGLPGLCLLSRKDEFRNKHLFDRQFLYQPASSAWGKRMSIDGRLKKYFNITPKKDGPVKYIYNYDNVWKKIIKNANNICKKNLILGSFVMFDDTPRRGSDARVIKESSPKKFKKYFENIYEIACNNNQEIMLITAWNEWGEGAYLEPDKDNGYEYLEALREAVADVDKKNAK